MMTSTSCYEYEMADLIILKYQTGIIFDGSHQPASIIEKF